MKNNYFYLLIILLFGVSCSKKDGPVNWADPHGEINLTVSIRGGVWDQGEPEVSLVFSNDKNDYPLTDPEFSALRIEDDVYEEFFQYYGGKELPTKLSIDWGDGTIDSKSTHIYYDMGRYNICIKGENIRWFSTLKSHFISVIADVSKCPALEGLLLSNVTENEFTGDGHFKLDLSFNPNLKYLQISSRMIYEMDISNCKKLQGLNISTSIHDIQVKIPESLDLSYISLPGRYNKELINTILPQSKNVRYLNLQTNSETDIDLSSMTQLKYLRVAGSDLENCDLSANQELKEVILHAPFVQFDFSKHKKLRNLTLSDVSNTTLNLTKNSELSHLYCSKILALTTIDVRNCGQLKSITSIENPSQNKILIENCSMLESLKISPIYFFGEVGMNDLFRSLPTIIAPKTGKIILNKKIGDWSIIQNKGWEIEQSAE